MRRDAEAIGRDDGVNGVVVSGHGELEQFCKLQKHRMQGQFRTYLID